MFKKLEVKDLITVGIFTALYFVVFYSVGMLGVIPIFYLLYPFILPFATVIPFILFLTKVKKFGMVSLMGVILGLMMLLTGHTWIPLVLAVTLAIISDYIFYLGDYKNFNKLKIGYAIFSLWFIGNMLPLYLMRNSFLLYIKESMGVEYMEVITKLTPSWSIYLMVIIAFITGYYSSFFAKKVLFKQLNKAGIH